MTHPPATAPTEALSLCCVGEGLSSQSGMQEGSHSVFMLYAGLVVYKKNTHLVNETSRALAPVTAAPREPQLVTPI